MQRIVLALVLLTIATASHANPPGMRPRPGGPVGPVKPVEIVNPDPIQVEIQEPLQVEIVGETVPPASVVSRTVLRDAYGALVGSIPGEFLPDSTKNTVVLDIDGREVAVWATQLSI